MGNRGLRKRSDGQAFGQRGEVSRRDESARNIRTKGPLESFTPF